MIFKKSTGPKSPLLGVPHLPKINPSYEPALCIMSSVIYLDGKNTSVIYIVLYLDYVFYKSFIVIIGMILLYIIYPHTIFGMFSFLQKILET